MKSLPVDPTPAWPVVAKLGFRPTPAWPVVGSKPTTGSVDPEFQERLPVEGPGYPLAAHLGVTRFAGAPLDVGRNVS